MLDPETRKSVDVAMKNLRIIWGALLGSLVLYAFFAFYLRGAIDPSAHKAFPPTLRWALYLVSVITFILAYYIRKMLMNSKRAVKGWTRAMGNRQSPAIARYTSAVVVGLAVAESIGIYGLILYVFFGKPSDLVSLMLFSAVAMILLRPKRDELLELIARPSVGGAS